MPPPQPVAWKEFVVAPLRVVLANATDCVPFHLDADDCVTS